MDVLIFQKTNGNSYANFILFLWELTVEDLIARTCISIMSTNLCSRILLEYGGCFPHKIAKYFLLRSYPYTPFCNSKMPLLPEFMVQHMASCKNL